MKGLDKRITQLEKAELDRPRRAVVILGLEGNNLETMTGLDCAPDHPRLDGESVDAYLEKN